MAKQKPNRNRRHRQDPAKGKDSDGSGRKSGRRTRCNKNVISDICAAIAAGAYIETAVDYAGVPRSKFYEWLKKGAKDEEDNRESTFRVLKDEIGLAMAKAEIADIATIRSHSQGYIADKETVVVKVDAAGQEIERKSSIEKTHKRDWQAAAWRLERRHPDRWGRRDTNINVDATEAGPGAILYLPERDVLPEAADEKRRALAIAEIAVQRGAVGVAAGDLPPLNPPENGDDGGNGGQP